MKVKKRDGHLEDVSFDKVLNRLKNLIEEFNLTIDAGIVAQKVCGQIYDGVKTSELDEFAAELCIGLITDNSDYGILASTIIISNNHKNTSPSFSEAMSKLYNNKDINGKNSPIIDEKLYKIVGRYHKKINASMRYDRDYLLDYFGYKTLERAYLLKKNDEIIERPQHMWMRVAIGIHGKNIKKAIETYNYMSKKYFTHASPTLFNCGTPNNQLSSCFLLTSNDSIEGIFKSMTDCGKISKYAGGIGISVTNIRAKGSRIRGTNGKSDGLIPMLKVYNEIARYINQGGKRKGSFSIYLEPWHYDIEDFLDIRKNHGDENMRARDLFTAIWMCDLFMERVENNDKWSLMCPDECPGLTNTFAKEFKELYENYEKNGKFKKQIKARDLWFQILTSQIETGTPYILYKDSINKKNNQSNLGVIKSSNLCAEIVEYTDDKNVAVCNLASIAVNMFVNEKTKSFDFSKLKEISKIVCRNLNKIIDINFYPIPETKHSNLTNRPIGIGIQGLADTFLKLRLEFESKEAKEINQKISESIYYGALEASCELSKEKGPYKNYKGSPISEGKFQWELWGDTPSDLWNWEELRSKIKEYGVRNSLTTAYMPTASTSQILGNNECLSEDTYISNINGLNKKIKNFILMDNVFGFNDKTNNLELTECSNKLDKGVKNTLKITFYDGRKLICTEDHKLLTLDGWKEAKDLDINKDTILSSMIGINDNEDDENNIIYSKKIGEYNFNFDDIKNREKFLIFCRLIGFILADGCITKRNVVSLYLGCNIDVEMVKSDIHFLNGEYNVYENKRTFCLRIKGKLRLAIIDCLKYRGKRINGGYEIPNFLFEDNCPKSLIREFLGGHFGGDGVAPFLIYDKKSKIPHFGQIELIHAFKEKCQISKNNIVIFMEKIQNLLDKLDINSYIKFRKPSINNNSFKSKKYDIEITRLVIKNNLKFSEIIGFRYSIQKILRNDLGKIYWNYQEQIIEEKYKILNKILQLYEKNKNYSKSLDIINKKWVNKTISKFSFPNYDNLRYYRKNNKKITFIKHLNPEDLFNKMNCLHWFKDKYIIGKYDKNLKYFNLPILKIEQYQKEHVWDLSINKYHSFLANGLVVHNCFEPVTSNIYVRRTLAGEFVVVNKFLINDLVKLGLWNNEMKNRIIVNRGSIQNISEIPDNIKKLYKIVWEISQKSLIDLARSRAPYIDQTQSMNLFIANPNFKNLSSMHFYSWKQGLKTGIYYLRTRPKTTAQQFTINPNMKKNEKEKIELEQAKLLCSINNKEECQMCSA